MSSFSLKIIASDKVFFDGRAEAITIPAMDGQKQILSHHENMVIAVDVGELKFRTEDGEVHQVVVGKGFAETMNNRVIVLTDTAEKPEDIDKKELRKHLIEQWRECVKSKVFKNIIIHKLLWQEL